MTTSTVDLRVEPAPRPPNTIVLAPPPPQRRATPPRTTAADGPSEPQRVRRHNQLEMRAFRLVQALVEIIDGDRPVTQLVKLSTSAVYQDLVGRLSALSGATAGGTVAEPLSTRVASVHVEQPAPTSAEISARIVQGDRSRALALRIDQTGGRWICSAIRWG